MTFEIKISFSCVATWTSWKVITAVLQRRKLPSAKNQSFTSLLSTNEPESWICTYASLSGCVITTSNHIPQWMFSGLCSIIDRVADKLQICVWGFRMYHKERHGTRHTVVHYGPLPVYGVLLFSLSSIATARNSRFAIKWLSAQDEQSSVTSSVRWLWELHHFIRGADFFFFFQAGKIRLPLINEIQVCSLP